MAIALPLLMALPAAAAAPSVPGPGKAVWAWGADFVGELGDGRSGASSPAPGLVPQPPGALSVAAGGDFQFGHSAAVGPDGSVWAWGAMAPGLPFAPTDCMPPSGPGGGTVRWEDHWWCWASPRPVPIPPAPGSLTPRAASVAAGVHHSLALLEDGTVWAWSNDCYGDYYGQLGDADAGHLTPPTDGCSNAGPVHVPLPPGVTSIATGGNFSVAVTVDGSVWWWGGYDTCPGFNVCPVLDALGHRLNIGPGGTVVADQLDEVAALSGSGNLVWVWRESTDDAGTDNPCFTPKHAAIPLPWLSGLGITKLAHGLGYLVALTRDGRVLGWGDNSDGGLGLSPQSTPCVSGAPIEVAGLTGIRDIAAGGANSEVSNQSPNIGGALGLAIAGDGSLWAWGPAEHGTGASRDYDWFGGPNWYQNAANYSPGPVGALQHVARIAVGSDHALVVTDTPPPPGYQPPVSNPLPPSVIDHAPPFHPGGVPVHAPLPAPAPLPQPAVQVGATHHNPPAAGGPGGGHSAALPAAAPAPPAHAPVSAPPAQAAPPAPATHALIVGAPGPAPAASLSGAPHQGDEVSVQYEMVGGDWRHLNPGLVGVGGAAGVVVFACLLILARRRSRAVPCLAGSVAHPLHPEL